MAHKQQCSPTGIKLIQVMASRQRGGAENFFARLARSLQETSPIEQHCFLRSQSPYLTDLPADIPTTTFNLSQSWNPLHKRRLQKKITSIDPNIILTWMNRASKIIGDLWPQKRYHHIARLGGFYNLKYYQHCDHFIANTTAIADYLTKSGIPVNKVHMISNFIEETAGKPLKERPTSPLIVSVGRLHKNKAFDTLIKAIEKLESCHLWIIGDGPEKAALAHLITTLDLGDRVKLLGWKHQPQDYVATGDIFICPSRHEPLGNVILEAWYQKKPVIATKTHGAKELITNMENGLLCEIDAVNDMAGKIQELLQNIKSGQTIGLQGYQTYQQKFSKSIITQQYIEYFHNILNH